MCVIEAVRKGDEGPLQQHLLAPFVLLLFTGAGFVVFTAACFLLHACYAMRTRGRERESRDTYASKYEAQVHVSIV